MNQKFMGLIIGGFLLIGVSLFIFLMFRGTLKESEVILKETSFEVTGQYGDEFNYEEITSIELKDTAPKVTAKTNGAALKEVKKGYFTVEELGKCKLYIHSENGPFLYLKINDIYVIINFVDENKTETLYNDLSDKLTNP